MINYVNYSKHFTFHKDKRRDCLETKPRMKHIRIKVHNHSRFWLSSQSSEQYLAEEAHDVWHQVKMTEESGKMSSKDCVTYRIWGEVLLPTLLFLLSSLFLLLHFLSPAPVFTSMVITWLNFHTCVLLTYPSPTRLFVGNKYYSCPARWLQIWLHYQIQNELQV